MKNLYESVKSNKARSLSTVLDDIQGKQLITSEERTQIENTGSVTIGSKTIDFSDNRLFRVAKVGDYVNYSPDTTVTRYKLEKEYTGRSEDYYLDRELLMLMKMEQ